MNSPCGDAAWTSDVWTDTVAQCCVEGPSVNYDDAQEQPARMQCNGIILASYACGPCSTPGMRTISANLEAKRWLEGWLPGFHVAWCCERRTMRVVCEDVSVWVPRRLQFDPGGQSQEEKEAHELSAQGGSETTDDRTKMQDRADYISVPGLEEKLHLNSCCRRRMGET